VKKAIVIGNKNYMNIPILRNPINDAIDIKHILALKDFDVDYYEDLIFHDFLKLVQNISDKNEDEIIDEIFFYFAGHSIQFLDRNYLLPIDIDSALTEVNVLERQSICLDEIAEAIQIINGPKIVILDSCRNNVLDGTVIQSDDIFNKGLLKVESKENTLIAYSTKPGSTAKDGKQNNGLYTSVLKTYLKRYGLSINEIFVKTREEVIQKSNFEQIPWESSSLTKDYYLDQIGSPIKLIGEIPIKTKGIDTICISDNFNILISTQDSVTFVLLTKEKILPVFNIKQEVVKEIHTESPEVRKFQLENDYIEKAQSYTDEIFFGVSEKGNLYRFNISDIFNEPIISSHTFDHISYTPEIIYTTKNSPFHAISVDENYLVVADSKCKLYVFKVKNKNGDIDLLQIKDISSNLSGIHDLLILDTTVFIAGPFGINCLDLVTFNISELSLESRYPIDSIDTNGKELFANTTSNIVLIVDLNDFNVKEFDIGRKSNHPILNVYSENCENDKKRRVSVLKQIRDRFLILGTNEPSILFYDLSLKEKINELYLDPHLTNNFYSEIFSLDAKHHILVARSKLNHIGIWELQI